MKSNIASLTFTIIQSQWKKCYWNVLSWLIFSKIEWILQNVSVRILPFINFISNFRGHFDFPMLKKIAYTASILHKQNAWHFCIIHTELMQVLKSISWLWLAWQYVEPHISGHANILVVWGNSLLSSISVKFTRKAETWSTFLCHFHIKYLSYSTKLQNKNNMTMYLFCQYSYHCSAVL